MTALVTLGETMAVLAADRPGPLACGTSLRLGFAGAEATVAIGVSRLGHQASWTGRVGADSAGTMILDGLRGESVDVSRARVDDTASTGLMLRERRTPDHTRVTYYRRGLAGSRLAPDDIDPELVTRARVLHVTGITPALGDAPAPRSDGPSTSPAPPASPSPWTSTTGPGCGPGRRPRPNCTNSSPSPTSSSPAPTRPPWSFPRPSPPPWRARCSDSARARPS